MKHEMVEKIIKIGIAEDKTLLRQMIIKTLGEEANIDISLETNNGFDLINQLPYKRIDVAILDLNMPILNARETLSYINKMFPKINTIVVSSEENQGRIEKYFKLGAKGFLYKNCSYSELKLAIETVAEGRLYLNESANYNPLTKLKNYRADLNAIDDPLTKRETEVLKLVCQELTNKEIGGVLGLSSRTIENHTMHLRRKTGAKTPIGLMKYALKNKIVSI